MAGKPGRSGGARVGSGPKPKEAKKLSIPVPVVDSLAHKDPKVFLLALMNDLEADVKLRAEAAKSLMPFMHARMEGGKKDGKQDAAEKASTGRFGASAPPRLISSRG